MVLIEGTCTSGGGFLRRGCGAPPVGQCVYCGEPFCEQHGEFGVDYHQVCSRIACRRRYEDMIAHRAWVAAHFPRNATSMCAEDACPDRMEHECQLCQLRFCSAHLRSGRAVDRRLDPPRKMAKMMCAHCTARRRIWD